MKTSNKMKRDENGNELWSFFPAEAVFSTQSAFHDRIIDEIFILFKFFYRLLKKNVFHGNRFCWSNKKKRHNDSQFSVIFPQFPVSFFRICWGKKLFRWITIGMEYKFWRHIAKRNERKRLKSADDFWDFNKQHIYWFLSTPHVVNESSRMKGEKLEARMKLL